MAATFKEMLEELSSRIVQGGMGVRISLSGLASAVMAEGGLGVISLAAIGMGEPNFAKKYFEANISAAKEEIRKAREMAKGILGVNIMVALSDFASMVEIAIKERVDVIFSGAGLPLDLPRFLTDGSLTKLVPIISSGKAARVLCKKWLKEFNYLPDGFVVEGPKAGGHLGFSQDEIDNPNFALEKLVTDVVQEIYPFEKECKKEIAVIPAGGIWSGKDVEKFLCLGFPAVQMATRFVATDECDAALPFKQSYVDSKEGSTCIIKSPVGMPGRAIRNKFIQDTEEGGKKPDRCFCHCIKTCDPKKAPYCISKALQNAQKGDLDEGFAFAGANVHQVEKIVPVRELMEAIQKERQED
ncbi:MAG: nitronate monooxygenase family protein [Parcubacteria group bacterium]|jgi:nitronate monooxygenase